MATSARYQFALIVFVALAALEFWGGIVAHSLALTADALHVTMDVLALGVALAAAVLARRRANARKTFGYARFEVLGALFNGALLLTATAFVAYAAALRFHAPVEPHGVTMTIVAGIGLAVNIGVGLLLASSHAHDLNARAALYHVIGDALGALMVIIGGVAIALTHMAWIDPALSLCVAAIIVVGIVRVLRDAADVVLESVPPGIDCRALTDDIDAIDGVQSVHDLHVWSIGSSSTVLTAHVVIAPEILPQGGEVLEHVRTLLQDRYGIGHVTVQLECNHCDPAGVVVCSVE